MIPKHIPDWKLLLDSHLQGVMRSVVRGPQFENESRSQLGVGISAGEQASHRGGFLLGTD